MSHSKTPVRVTQVRIPVFVIWAVAALPIVCSAKDVLSAPRPDIGLLVEVARSIVRIEADRPGSGIRIGTGIVLSDGEIATACHVVRNARSVTAIYAGRRHAMSNLRALPSRDVCAFSVIGLEAPVVKVRPAGHLQIGEAVTGLGFSGGAGVKWKAGSVLRKHRFAGSVVVQTTTQFNSGASGGPLLDSEGNVVGLLSFRTRGRNPNFYAVPVEWAIDAIELNADLGQADAQFSTLPFWDGRDHELPFFMRASSLEAEQRWDELRYLCNAWQEAEPESGEPAFVASRVDAHFGHFEAVHDRLVYAVGLDERHVLAWAALVRIRLHLDDMPGARNAYSKLRVLNMHVANQLVDEGLITVR